MRVNCREQIANPAEPVNGQDERRKCAAVDSPARLCCSVIKRATAQDAAALCHYWRRTGKKKPPVQLGVNKNL